MNVSVYSDVDGSIHKIVNGDDFEKGNTLSQSGDTHVVMECKDYLIFMITTSEGQHSKTVNC